MSFDSGHRADSTWQLFREWVAPELEESGLVRTEKLGRVRTCRLDPVGFSVAEKWIADRRSMWEKRFDRLGDLLVEEDEA